MGRVHIPLLNGTCMRLGFHVLQMSQMPEHAQHTHAKPTGQLSETGFLPYNKHYTSLIAIS